MEHFFTPDSLLPAGVGFSLWDGMHLRWLLICAALIAALASVSLTTLSTGSALAEETAPLTFGADLGDVMYVGDSITHGIAAASWRWSMHKIFVDAGVSYDENGYNTGNDPGYSGRLEPDTPYGGVVFENVHSAHSGGDAFEVIGRAKRGSGHYGNSNIYNWLGLDKELTEDFEPRRKASGVVARVDMPDERVVPRLADRDRVRLPEDRPRPVERRGPARRLLVLRVEASVANSLVELDHNLLHDIVRLGRTLVRGIGAHDRRVDHIEFRPRAIVRPCDCRNVVICHTFIFHVNPLKLVGLAEIEPALPCTSSKCLLPSWATVPRIFKEQNARRPVSHSGGAGLVKLAVSN